MRMQKIRDHKTKVIEKRCDSCNETFKAIQKQGKYPRYCADCEDYKDTGNNWRD